jgi:hypothetical protein
MTSSLLLTAAGDYFCGKYTMLKNIKADARLLPDAFSELKTATGRPDVAERPVGISDYGCR